MHFLSGMAQRCSKFFKYKFVINPFLSNDDEFPINCKILLYNNNSVSSISL